MRARLSILFLFATPLATAGLACSAEDEPQVRDGTGGAESTGSGGESTQSGGQGSGGEATTGSGGSVQSSGGATGSGGSISSGGSGTGGAEIEASGGAASTTFALMSPAWDEVDNEDCTPQTTDVCPLYPQDNTSFGENVSPEMSWVGVPQGTQSFAIVLHDLTNPNVHWAIWDIPASVTMLPASLPSTATLTEPAGAKQATNFGQMGYFGSGKCGNTYEHRLYALSVATLEPDNPSSAVSARDKLEASASVLAETFVRLQSRDYCD